MSTSHPEPDIQQLGSGPRKLTVRFQANALRLEMTGFGREADTAKIGNNLVYAGWDPKTFMQVPTVKSRS